MKKSEIEDLAYVIKQAKENNQPKPIFFLGAGASATGRIPTAKDIVKDILEKFPYSPTIKRLKKEEQTYPKLMECLQPYERDKLLKGYIDQAKINVTHIYLAQLLSEGFVDYVLTVNFDNLMLRALSLFNQFPFTYDMAILKDLTTTAFKEKSVVYLHGQHHGLWLLNTEEEMKKVRATVPRIFDSIKSKRPWVFIGYSGYDPIFEHIKNLGRFDNGLYWVSYKNNLPSKEVQDFLNTDNTNASLIEGYDADSFMLKLNGELGLEQPKIIDKPFTSIGEMLDNIVDIDEEEHFKGVKERLEISKDQVKDAIKQFEKGEIVENDKLNKKHEIDLLKKEIIDLIITEEYNKSKIDEIGVKVERIDDEELNSSLSNLYLNWGNSLVDLAKNKEGEVFDKLCEESIDKYKKAIDIKPGYYKAFYNWGVNLADLAKNKEGEVSDKLYEESIDKYKKAIDIKPDFYLAFSNLGNNLSSLAKRKEGKASDKLYEEAMDKCKKAVDLGDDSYNLSCIYALCGDKTNAFKFLSTSLSKNEIDVEFVLNDKDWEAYLNDKDFKNLISKYK